MAQHEHGALIGRQMTEPALELIAHRNVVLRVGPASVVHREPQLEDIPSPLPSRHAEAGVDEQPVEPAIEPIGIPEGPQVPPGQEQGVLHRVGCPVVIAEDQSGGRIQTCGSAPRQGREGVNVTLLRSEDELVIHMSEGEGGGGSPTRHS